MNHIEKEKLIKADIASIENRVRHAFNQGYDLGYKEGKANCSENPNNSTTKNDLGVERQIKEICISYPKSDLKEHDGQPYYSVTYIENGEEYEGYGTYKIEVLMEYLRNYFMPSVTPQEPIDYKTQYENYLKKSEVVISQLRAERDRLQDAFDKLRVEIEEPLKINQGLNTESAKAQAIALSWVLEVIDKYKAKSDPQESEDKE